MRTAIYVRVSTQRQVQSQSVDQQLASLRHHIERQGWTLLADHIFRDDGYSGSTLKRPGLDRLRDRAAAAAFDRILVTSPDRLARKDVHQVLLIDALEHYGCQVEFLDRPRSQDPHDQLLLQIRGAVAEYERTLITERMRRGRLMKYREGTLLPWTRPPYGYRLHPERPRDPTGVRVEPAEAAIVTEIFAEYLKQDVSLIKVAKHLYERGVPSPTGQERWGLATIRGLLTNPAYTGQVFAGRMRYRPAKIRRSATHPMGRPHDTATLVPREEWIPVAKIPALVTQTQFELVQAKLAKNQSFASRHNTTHQYLLRALVSCGICHYSCFARTVKAGNYGYYICSGKEGPVQKRGAEKCPSRFIPAQQLDDLVWQDLCDLLQNGQAVAWAMQRAHAGHWLPQELQARQDNLRRGQNSLEQQLNRLTEAYLASVIPLDEYQRRRQEIEQRLRALHNQAEQLLLQIEHQQELAGLVTHVEEFCQRVQAGLLHASFEQKRQLVELLIDRVIVTDSEVEIRYAIPTTAESEYVRFCHLRTDYFGRPDLVRSHDLDVAQQVRIDAILWIDGRRPPFGKDGLQSHQLHQALDALVVHWIAKPL